MKKKQIFCDRGMISCLEGGRDVTGTVADLNCDYLISVMLEKTIETGNMVLENNYLPLEFNYTLVPDIGNDQEQNTLKVVSIVTVPQSKNTSN